MARRKKRMNKGVRLAIEAKGKVWLANQLGIAVQSINHWKRIPRRRLLLVHMLTHVPLSKLAPDLFT